MNDLAIVASGVGLVIALLVGLIWLASSSVQARIDAQSAACVRRGGAPVAFYREPRVICFAPGVVILGDH